MTARPPVRWTEHGPEPALVEELPVSAEPLVGPTESPADAPPVATAPSPLASTSTDEPTAPAAPPRLEPEAGTEADPQAVRARLAARGLLRTERSVRILDVAASPVRPVETAPDLDDAATDPAPSSDMDDADDIDAEPTGGPAVPVRCLSCRSVQEVALAATAYQCTSCRKVWRWAVCDGCDELSATLARQESWRCRSCGASTRAWWRTAEAPRRAVEVADRRRVQATRLRRRGITRAIGRQRTKLVVAAVVAALVAAVLVLVGRIDQSADDAIRDSSAVTCSAFRSLDRDLAGGGLPAAALRSRLGELAAGAADADDAVRVAAERFAASGQPGDPPFEEARTELARRCPP